MSRGAIRFAVLTAAFSCLSGSALAGWDRQDIGTAVDLHDITASHSTNDIAWACGDSGAIFHTSNAGQTWIRQNSGTDLNLYAIAFQELADGPVLAAGENGTILRTSNNGATWQALSSGTTETLRAISDFGLIIVGDNGTILHSTDSVNWTAHQSNTTANLNGVGAGGSRLAVGDDGTILVASGSGTVWATRASGTSEHLYGTPMFSSFRIAVGGAGTMLRSTNGGVSWEPIPVGVGNTLRSVEFSTNNTSRIYCVGDDGIILKTTDHGVTWGTQESGVETDLRSCFFYLSDQKGWAAGSGGVILYTADGGGVPVPTAIGESSAPLSESVLLSPNPSRGRIDLGFEMPMRGPVHIEALDASGRRLGSGWTVEHAAGATPVPLDLSSLGAGTFFLRVQTESGAITKRVVLIR